MNEVSKSLYTAIYVLEDAFSFRSYKVTSDLRNAVTTATTKKKNVERKIALCRRTRLTFSDPPHYSGTQIDNNNRRKRFVQVLIYQYSYVK
eukprot:gene9098-6391_t